MKAEVSFAIWSSPTEPWGMARGTMKVAELPAEGEFFDLRQEFSWPRGGWRGCDTLEVSGVHKADPNDLDLNLIFLQPAVVDGDAQVAQMIQVIEANENWKCTPYSSLDR